MRRVLFFIVSLTILLGLAPANATEEPELPPAPEGFSWKQLEPIDAHFLIPDGWYYRFEENEGTLAYFITKTEIVPGELFDVGLSLNVLDKMRERTGNRNAVQYARDYIGACQKQYDDVKAWQFEQAPFKGYGCEFSSQPKPDRRIRMSMLAIANTQTDTLYVMWFESPADQWEEAWQTGEILMSGFALEDNY